jgi:Ca-activated chloride channel family protein
MKGILVILVLAATVAQAQSSQHARKANILYKEKKFNESLPEYQKAAGENAEDPVVNYNLGDAYFRTEKFEEAGRSYDKLLAEGNDPALRQRAFYNKGVSLSRQSKLEESIAAFKSALLLNPEDNDARVNLQKAMLELKKKQYPEKDKKEDEKKDKQQKKEDPPPTQSRMNKKQVDQLLKALDQREQQVQQKMLQNRTRAVTKPDKDW